MWKLVFFNLFNKSIILIEIQEILFVVLLVEFLNLVRELLFLFLNYVEKLS